MCSAAPICWSPSCGVRAWTQADGAVVEVARAVARIRACWPAIGIMLRRDSRFAREDLMAWCEANDVDFVLGLAQTSGSSARIKSELRR